MGVQGPQSEEYLAKLKYKIGDTVETLNDRSGLPKGSFGVIVHVGAPNGDDYVVRPKEHPWNRTFNELSLKLVRDTYEDIREAVMSEFDSTGREILDNDAGDYGYGGEWFSHPAIDKFELAEFVIDLVKKGILKP